MALHYGKETQLTWRRVKNGSGFKFVKESGKPVSKNAISRIKKLVIPPAWKEVVVSDDPTNYIQAIGVDAAGIKQYIYHPEWVKKSQEKKFDQMISFGERLPTLRKAVSAHMEEHSDRKSVV